MFEPSECASLDIFSVFSAVRAVAEGIDVGDSFDDVAGTAGAEIGVESMTTETSKTSIHEDQYKRLKY